MIRNLHTEEHPHSTPRCPSNIAQAYVYHSTEAEVVAASFLRPVTMSTAGSLAGLETFERVEIDYELAYGDNPLKKACVEAAISLTSPGQRVLDVGCGTGVPVSHMLCNAGLDVVGIDISPKMIAHAKSRVRGTFIQADLLQYEPKEEFAAVFIIFSLLQLSSYSDFEDLMTKYARAVQANGLLVVGTMPADNYVTDPVMYDATGTYALDYPTPFMGEMEKTFFLTSRGLVDYITSLDFEIVSNELGVFEPIDSRCVPEDQQYIVARRMAAK